MRRAASSRSATRPGSRGGWRLSGSAWFCDTAGEAVLHRAARRRAPLRLRAHVQQVHGSRRRRPGDDLPRHEVPDLAVRARADGGYGVRGVRPLLRPPAGLDDGLRQLPRRGDGRRGPTHLREHPLRLPGLGEPGGRWARRCPTPPPFPTATVPRAASRSTCTALPTRPVPAHRSSPTASP